MKKIKVALAGNPNVGKSTVFNSLTGMHQHTGNWAGKTVVNAVGKCTYEECEYEIYDLPGTYSLNTVSEDEEAAREFIVNGDYDCVVVVCDATCLERNLVLALQIMNVTDRVVLCVNLMDEAKRRGVKIDFDALSGMLGVPVIAAEARSKKGIYEALSAADSEFGGAFRSSDPINDAEKICTSAVIERGKTNNIADRILTGKYTAFPIMLIMLGGIFWLTVKAANVPSQWLSECLTGLNNMLGRAMIGAGVPDVVVFAVRDGILNVMFRVVSVMLPPMAIFFPLFTFLEDLGYLPRIAFNLDRVFFKCNACGKQALTMCMGLGCNAVGVTGCRIISSPRERLIAILTNSFMPCNGRFPALIAIIVIFFSKGSGFLSAGILMCCVAASVAVTFFISYVLSKTYLKGEPSAFTLELPPFRRPQAGKIIIRSVFDRTVFILGRAVMVAAPSGLIIWILANVRVGDAALISHITGFLDPFGRFMGLDGCILTAFILGFPANEIVIPIALMAYSAGGMLTDFSSYDALRETLVFCGWNDVTAVCMLVFTLFHWPCSTTVLGIYKETGSVSKTVAGVLVPTLTGIVICSLISHIL